VGHEGIRRAGISIDGVAVLYRTIDLTDLKQAGNERDERLGRIDAGIEAVREALVAFKAAKIPVPDGTLAVPAEELFQFRTERDGKLVAKQLADAVGRVVSVQAEITAAEERVAAGEQRVAAETKARAADIRTAMKLAVRIIGVLLVILALRHCAGK
jgi:hypothetical protein